ncbi:hypothetical protein vBAmePPT11V19_00083 [Alteromonas phage vB_AmeP_PT11-V19]|nr:hypothetical protein vBAmePPT11V19_00083 [Alteromonas phage vB_AmeP_PT11-V19]
MEQQYYISCHLPGSEREKPFKDEKGKIVTGSIEEMSDKRFSLIADSAFGFCYSVRPIFAESADDDWLGQ